MVPAHRPTPHMVPVELYDSTAPSCQSYQTHCFTRYHNESLIDSILDYVKEENFTANPCVVEQYGNSVRFSLPFDDTADPVPRGHIFGSLERNKDRLNISEYCVSVSKHARETHARTSCPRLRTHAPAHAHRWERPHSNKFSLTSPRSKKERSRRRNFRRPE